ncbi:transglutaminase domain-containing protein [Candidatus Woesearchaeota archaeon]|nr:transglutaminase domain-containing protein [Candidatus Woesearchaeota archaeon]
MIRSVLKKFLIITFMLICASFAGGKIEGYENYSALETFVEVYSEINISHLTDNYAIEYLNANLTFFPRKYDTQIFAKTKISAEPQAQTEERENSIFYYWGDAEKYSKLNYKVEGNVKTINSFVKIQQKIPFPLQYVPKEILSYTQPTKTVVINDAIKKQAAELAQGEDDMYEVTFKIADWVQKNVEYDLNTMTAKAVKDSVWVFENRQGVCDELTNLYLAMLRSLGIPARFVSGQVYSNVINGFGAHGWAEVFFPGYGWVPVDVTFGQFGWIDPSHITFQVSEDATTPAVDYQWKSRNIEVETGELEVEVSSIKSYGPEEKFIQLKVETLKGSVGFGSFIPLLVTLENPNKFYVPTSVFIVKAPGLLDKSNVKTALLKPLSKKTLFWVIKVPQNLNKELIYTAEIEATAIYGNKARTEIEYAEGFEVYTESWAQEIVDKLQEVSKKNLFSELKFDCSLAKEKYYKKEKANVDCTIKNVGNTNLDKINTCLELDCKEINLTIAEEKKFSWTMNLTNAKSQKLVATAEYQNKIASSYPTLYIVEIPKISVENFTPQSIEYDEDGNMEFTLKSSASAKEVVVNIEGLGAFKVDSLIGEHDFSVPFKAKNFYKQKVLMKLFFKDELGKEYEEENEFNIMVTNLPWYIKLLNWIDSLI